MILAMEQLQKRTAVSSNPGLIGIHALLLVFGLTANCNLQYQEQSCSSELESYLADLPVAETLPF